MNFMLLLAVLLTVPSGMAWAIEGRARVVFVGDVMLAESEGTGRFVARGGDPFAQVKSMLAAADLRVANFESSAGTQGKPDFVKPYSFRTAQPALIKFASVFEAASVANNHAGDYGRKNFVETLESLHKAGTQTFGGGSDQAAAHRAQVFERHGLKIAVLGYLDSFPRWFAAAPGLPGVAWLDRDQAALDIDKARQDGADIVVVVPHWGTEHEPKANKHQRRIARSLLDAGADAVIGGHPHVVQDYEVYKDKPIVYSLGNFVFDGFEDENNVTGWALFVDFDKQGVASLSTQGVRMDANGSPVPEPKIQGPCWRRGQAQMSRCKMSRVK